MKQKFNPHFDFLEKRNLHYMTTSFTYQLKDPKKHDVVIKAVVNLKGMIAYAMLFNEKLAFYEFTDNR